MSILKYTRDRLPELADYLEAVCMASLNFDGEDPLDHSRHNHIHLWKVEYLADYHEWIDIEYRNDFIKYVLEQWRQRLKGMPPYREGGYLMYVYEDAAPTISVVANTEFGFPYYRTGTVFVNSIKDVVKVYENRSWKARFEFEDWEISEKAILGIIENQKGSISKPTADRLGLTRGALRQLIRDMGLEDEVNALRKKYKRRPADLEYCDPGPGDWRIFERILKPGYR